MFPAYKSQDLSAEDSQTCKEFLQNPSYNAIPVTSSLNTQQISSSSDSSDFEDDRQQEKIVNKVKKPQTPPPIEVFYVDRARTRDYLKLEFLPNRAVPFYKIKKRFNLVSQSNKGKFRRYYNVKRIKKLVQDPERLIDEKVSKDEEMRLYLIRNSQEVDKWIEYISYKVSKTSLKTFSVFKLHKKYYRNKCHLHLENKLRKSNWKSSKKLSTSTKTTRN